MFSKSEIVVPDGFKKYDLFNPSEGAHHEAGFDALLTGYCFIKMFDKLDAEGKKSVKSVINVMKAYHCVALDKEEDNFNRTVINLSESALIIFFSEPSLRVH